MYFYQLCCYERKAVHERTCLFCTNCVEDEFHVLMQCPLYADLRQKMSNDVLNFNANFSFLSDADKFLFLFSNENVFNIVAKTCYNTCNMICDGERNDSPL